jgi:hypothetical protein
VDSGESSGESKVSGDGEAVCVPVGVTVEVAVGEEVGVLLGSGGRSVLPGDGDVRSPVAGTPQAERKAASAAAAAPFRKRRRSRSI